MGLRNIIAKRDQTQTSLGRPLAGGSVFLYEPGTTTFIQAFQDSGLVTPHTAPIKLSGSGRANIWINRDCDIRIEDRNSNLILTEPNANPDSLGVSEVGGLINNGGFETDTDSDGTPDDWVLVDEAGSTNARDTSESTEGVASFRFTSAGTGGGNLTTTNFFPVNDVDDLRVNFDLRSTLATVRNIVRVEWYDVTQISISDTDVYDSTANPTVFIGQSTAATPPALARFAKLKLIGIDPSVALAGSTFFDRIEVFYPATVSGIFDNITIQNNEIITTNTNGDLDLNPNGLGEVNITAPLNVTGLFTSPGIDDNAIATSLAIADNDIGLGQANTNVFTIDRVVADAAIALSGGSSNLLGANIFVYGESHATNANDTIFIAGVNTWAHWDESLGSFQILTGVGAKTAALTIDANANFSMAGHILMAETASVGDPTAGAGRWWIKNDAPTRPYFQDDTNVERKIVTADPVVSGHIRAGNMQFAINNSFSGGIGITGAITESTFETVGPTGSGADNIWADMDVIPANATVLMVLAKVSVTPLTTGVALMTVNTVEGDEATPSNEIANEIVSVAYDADGATTTSFGTDYIVFIPLGATNQDFHCRWEVTGDVARAITFYYRGFLTD